MGKLHQKNRQTQNKNNQRRSPWFLLALGCLSILLGTSKAMAQGEDLPICESPEADEFLVLVFTPSPPLREEVRQQVGRTLPPAVNDLLVCQYNDNVLSRIGGFSSEAKATEWAEYFENAVGLPLMVITPVTATASAAIAPPTIPSLADSTPEVVIPTETVEVEVKPNTTAVQGSLQPESAQAILSATQNTTFIEPEEIVDPFNPQGLSGEGFGILVDYGDNPAIASEIQPLVNDPVALVTHGTRGYLMVAQAQDETRLIELLNLFSQNDFVAIAVPLPQIILLKADLTP